MQQYRNLNGNSSVRAFEILADAIIVQFSDGAKYRYSIRSAGAANVANMTRLATAGRGLGSFIQTHVRKMYEAKTH